MGERRPPGARLWAVLLLIGVLGLAALAVPWIWSVPERLHPPLTEAELRGLMPDQRLQRQQEQRKLQNDVRSALVQGLVGLLALTGAAIGASVAWRQLQENRRHQQRNEELSREQLQLSREQLRQALDTSQEQLRLTQEELRLTRESQIADRFTRAVEQLGSDALDVRLGGIYALERLAHDSPERDHPTVVEVLSAFIREGSRRSIQPPEPVGAQTRAEEPDTAAPESDARPSTDVQAALTVLGRLPQRPDVARGDLSGARLSGAVLFGADLSSARLSEVNLSGAELSKANLSGADFRGADLPGAWLDEANLSGVELWRANLSGAGLYGADLGGAYGISQPHLDAARGNATTRLPDGLRRPPSWTAETDSTASSS